MDPQNNQPVDDQPVDNAPVSDDNGVADDTQVVTPSEEPSTDVPAPEAPSQEPAAPEQPAAPAEGEDSAPADENPVQ